jgi:hypothetical protein
MTTTLKGAFAIGRVDSQRSDRLRLDEVAHQRIHGTTGAKPAERLEKERIVFLPLPASRAKPSCDTSFTARHMLPRLSLQLSLSGYD